MGIFNIFKNKRKTVFYNLITEAYANYEGQWVDSDVAYYEAAVKFTLENGGEISNISGNAIINLDILGDKVNIVFSKGTIAELSFMVSNLELQQKRMFEKMGIKR